MPILKLSLAAAAALLALTASGKTAAQRSGLQSDPNGPVIQIRLAQKTPAPGFSAMKELATDSVFYVAGRDIVSDSDIEYARAERRPGGLVIDVRFTPAGTNRLAEVGRDHRGGRIAILVDSRLVKTVVIADPRALSSGRAQIGLKLPEKDVEEIAESIAARWPE